MAVSGALALWVLVFELRDLTSAAQRVASALEGDNARGGSDWYRGGLRGIARAIREAPGHR
jgi:hypothetical protein